MESEEAEGGCGEGEGELGDEVGEDVVEGFGGGGIEGGGVQEEGAETAAEVCGVRGVS